MEPQGYTNDSVLINIQVQFKEGELKTLACETEGIEIIEANTKFKVRENGLYKFKVVDSRNNGKAITIPIEKIDKEAPNVAIELLTKTSYINGKIKAKVTFTDEKSGVDIGKCKWVLNNSDKNIGVDAGNYLGGSFTSDAQEIETRSITSTDASNMYLHVLSVDQIGNTKEFISDAITIKTGYAISTPQDLQNMKNNLSASYYVVNDIDMQGFNFKTINGTFTGTLDGQGHSIRNLSLAYPSTSGSPQVYAIFNYIAGEAKICNLLLKDVLCDPVEGYSGGVFAWCISRFRFQNA